MENNQIFFEIKDNQVRVHYRKPITLADFMTVVHTAMLSTMKATVEKTPAEAKEKVKEELYDMLNAAASNTLAYFAPEIEMRPHLTTQAILEAENAILERASKNAKRNKIKRA